MNCSRRVVAGLAAVLAAGLLAATGCGGTGEVRISGADQAALDAAMLRTQLLSHPIASPGCINVTRPITNATIHAYSLARVIAAKNPDALWQDPNDTKFHEPMGQYAAYLASVLRYCVTHTRSVNASWCVIAIPASPANLPMPPKTH